MPQFTRRDFIARTTLLAGAFATYRARGSDINSEIRVAVVGLNWRGGELVNDVLRTPGARLVALCDVDTAVLAEHAQLVDTQHGIKVDQVVDYRRLLDRDDIDAVVLATPNHWHALQTIWACQAGKDVYVEKPVCHTLWEGRQMIAAARKYKRIVQAGLQNRSDVGLKEAFAWIKEGNLGAIKQVRGLCYKNRASIGKRATPLPPPDTVDYDLWLGPAADEPLFREKFHYDWHWDWNTGNGDLGNQGVHEMDLMRWILDEPDHPNEVFSLGGRFAWDDAGDSPNMQLASIDWGPTSSLFEVRNLWVNPEVNAAPHYKGSRIGVIVTCEGGEFRGGRGGGIVYDEQEQRRERFKGDGGYDHFPSFIRAIRSRKESDLACTLETGYYSTAVALLSNISYRVGQQTKPGKVEKKLRNPLLEEAHERFSEQLEAWQIDLRKDPWTVGPRLPFDSDTESFSGGAKHKQANQLLRRDYRKNFEVPETV